MFPLTLFSLLLPLLPLSQLVRGYTYPNRLHEEIEHLLIDTGGFNSAGFADAVTPCSNYVQGPQTLGRESAGQWIRVGFHDFATADVEAGTGGIDASIAYETLRLENSGSAMNDSLGWWQMFSNEHVSMSDLVALGTTTAISACAGPALPLKAGRVDAKAPGAFGVPEPDTPLEETLKQFEKNGFSQVEAIQLTACGHTVGRVHHSGFPQVQDDSAVTPQNSGGGVEFDDTYTTFDNRVAITYLDDTTTNPLVKSFNVSSRSDLRLFISDKNATMKNLATSNSHFRDVCVKVMTKQLNTVPKGVVLSDVPPIAVKPVGLQVSVNVKGQVTFSGSIRLLGSSFAKNSGRVVTLDLKTRSGGTGQTISTSPVQEGSSIYLSSATYYYPFSAVIDPSVGLSGFTISIKESSKAAATSYTNGGVYGVQDKVVWLPDASFTYNAGSGKVGMAVVSAVLKSFSPSSSKTPVVATFKGPTPIPGAMNVAITSNSISLTRVQTPSRYMYDLFVGKWTLETRNNTYLRTTMDLSLGGVTDDFRKLSVLRWPSNAGMRRQTNDSDVVMEVDISDYV